MSPNLGEYREDKPKNNSYSSCKYQVNSVFRRHGSSPTYSASALLSQHLSASAPQQAAHLHPLCLYCHRGSFSQSEI